MSRLALVVIVALAIVGGDVAARGVAARDQPSCATPATGDAVTMVQTVNETRFWGDGDRVSEPFPLREGLAIMHVSAMRIEAFIDVTLYAQDGMVYSAPSVFEWAPYEGTIAGELRTAGDYRLAVEYDGPWAITIEQP